jgi:hypothetical protein
MSEIDSEEQETITLALVAAKTVAGAGVLVDVQCSALQQRSFARAEAVQSGGCIPTPGLRQYRLERSWALRLEYGHTLHGSERHR